MTPPLPGADARLSVLVVSTRFPPDVEGGYEKSCALVVDRLRARGHDVTVVARRHAGGSEPGVRRIMRYRFSGDRRLVLTGWIDDVLDLRAIRPVVDEVQPDVVYLWGIMGTCLQVVAQLSRRFPTVVYVADYWLSMSLSGERLTDGFAHQLKALSERSLTPVPAVNRLVQAVVGRAYRRMYSRWMTCSPFAVHFDSRHMADDVRSLGVVLARERVVPHGIEVGRFPYLAPADRPPASRGELLFVGRVVPVKGIETLLAAMPAILAEFPETRLTVAGPVEAAYAATLSKVAADLGVTHAVNMLGPQDQAALVSLYRDHQVLVFPSEWDEPFGIVLVEAMACGLPVLCSATGGSAEIVDGETTGLHFRPADAGDLAERALRLLRSADLRQALAAGARRHVEQHYDVERMVDVIEDDLVAARDSGLWP
jgi:glycogen(starch) synthase